MGTIIRFLAVGDEADAALAWFLGQPDPPEVIEKAGGHFLYFRNLGPHAYLADDSGVDSGVHRSSESSVPG